MLYNTVFGGYQPSPKVEILKKWAYFPRKSTSGKWIFCKEYIVRLERSWGPSGMGPAIEKKVFTKHEWTAWLLRNPPKKDYVLPTSSKSVVKKPVI